MAIESDESGVMAVRLLVALLTEEGQLAGLWAVADTAAAARQLNAIRERYPVSYQGQIMRLGDLLATPLLAVAEELEATTQVGDGAADPQQVTFQHHARRQGARQGIQRAAALVRHRGEQMKGWQL